MSTADKNYILSQMGNIISTDANGTITGMNSSSYTANLGPVGNVTITGGSNGQVLSTNGSGILSWSTVSTNNVANANYAAYSGIVTGSSQGNITNVGTLTGLTSNGTINFTGASNVSLGAVGNVTITGGSNGQFLTTNGSGALSWTSSGGSGLSGPAFMASTTNGIASCNNTEQNIPLNVASLNVGNCYDTTTYRFTPTTAGYYQIGASMRNSASNTFGNFFCYIYKNGLFYKTLYAMGFSSTSFNQFGFAASTMVPMNGSTDYIEVRWQGAISSGSGSIRNTFVEGTYIRPL